MPFAQLREIARDGLFRGRLPVVKARHLKAGYGGFGNRCELCGRQIERAQVEYYVTDVRGGRSLPFHLFCHGAWQFECDSVETLGLAYGAPTKERGVAAEHDGE